MAASATATISLCSSFATHCKISQNLQTPASHFSFPSLSSSSSHKLSSCSLRRPTFPLLIKSSESDSAVVVEADFQAPEPEAGPDDSKPAALQVVETPSSEAPKREQLFGVVMIGGRQYIVIPGRFIYTQRLKGANVNDKIVLNKVLLVGTKTSTYIGKPVVTNAAVHAVVEEQGLNDKVVVFKYKKKKNYRRNIGHRQVEIDVDSFVGSFRPDIMEAVYAWAKGSKFYEIMSATPVFEGWLIRAIRRLEEVLQQLIQAAKSVGETELESKFEEAVSKIKRDIVFAASLYL